MERWKGKIYCDDQAVIKVAGRNVNEVNMMINHRVRELNGRRKR